MFRDSFFLKGFFIFILLNLFLYIFIAQYYQLIPFNTFNYQENAHHHIPDNRVIGKTFNLTNALAQFDAQWYIKIADIGYPTNPEYQDMKNKSVMNSLTFAFFPLYPIVLNITNQIFHNIELTAFIISQIFLIANFISLFFITTKLFDKKIALITSFLLFLSPFSIVFRSYYSENLILFLLLWFSYFLIKKRLFIASGFLSFLLITKGNLLLLYPLYTYFLMDKKVRIDFKNKLLLTMIPLILIAIWVIFCDLKTVDPLFFMKIQSQWFSSPLPPIIYNYVLVGSFFELPLHYFHASKIDVLTVIIIPVILYFSKDKLPKELFWISVFLYTTPLLVKDLMAFSRIQLINFPIFIGLTLILKPYLSYSLIFIFYLLLLFTSLYFVNWYWVG